MNDFELTVPDLYMGIKNKPENEHLSSKATVAATCWVST